MLLLLLACAHAPDSAALDTRIAELEAARVADAARLDELQRRVDLLESASGPTGSGGDADPLAPFLGSHCDQEGDAWILPAADELTTEALTASFRAIPHRGAEGQVDGYRISAVRRGSLLDSCGFKNGDVVRAADGMPLASAEQVIEAYKVMMTRPTFTLSLLRRGAPEELTLRRRE